MICGIDEAGRGPIVGPMVMAGVSASKKNLKKLEKLGIKDSKLLTKEKREELYDQIIDIVDDYDIIAISAQEIDEYNFSGINLNKMEALIAGKIINKLAPKTDWVDSPEPANGGAKFGHMIQKHLKVDCEIIAEHKADLNYVITGAASILAKVQRDRELEKIKTEIGVNIGSGYPHDPLCVNYLKDNFRGPINKYLRKCWSTYKRLDEQENQTDLSNFQ